MDPLNAAKKEKTKPGHSDMETTPPLHIFIRRNSPNWWMWYLDPKTGRRTQVSTHLSMAEVSRKDAARIVNTLAPEKGEGKVDHTIGWLIERTMERLEAEKTPRKTICQYKNAFRYLLAIRSYSADIHTMKRDLIADYKLHCLNEGLAPVSVNTNLAYLHAAFSALVKSDILKENPLRYFEKVKTRSTKKRFLTLVETEHFLDVVNAWDHEVGRRLIRMILYLGLRMEEVMRITPADIDLAGSQIHALNIKRHDKRKRWIPFPTEIRGDIEYFLSNYDQAYDGTPGLPFFRCHPSTLSHWTKKLLKQAGFTIQNTYSLRHTFGTLAIENGMNIRDLQRYYDHSSIVITEGYAHDISRFKKAPSLGLKKRDDAQTA
jgi:integrase